MGLSHRLISGPRPRGLHWGRSSKAGRTRTEAQDARRTKSEPQGGLATSLSSVFTKDLLSAGPWDVARSNGIALLSWAHLLVGRKTQEGQETHPAQHKDVLSSMEAMKPGRGARSAGVPWEHLSETVVPGQVSPKWCHQAKRWGRSHVSIQGGRE